jgi:uncharacterized protein (TIGR02246 family)
VGRPVLKRGQGRTNGRSGRSWTACSTVGGRGDAPAYHADFTDDADYVAFDGPRRSTADTIRSHENLFRTVLHGGRLTGQVESVRFVTPDVAVAHLTGSVVEGWRQTMRRRRLSRQTMVVRRDGRWQVTAFHNTRVRPLATSGPMLEVGGRFVRWRANRARRKRRRAGRNLPWPVICLPLS